MDPDLFLTDLEEKPARLAALAASLRAGSPWSEVLPRPVEEIVLVGMGSSHYAGSVAAARLRALGVNATAVLASSDLLPPVTDGTLVLGVSATGGSRETLAALERLQGAGRRVALTNRADTALAELCEAEVSMEAGEERGGVACRSFQHTLVQLLALQSVLAPTSVVDLPGLVDRAAAAAQDLLDRRTEWLGPVSEVLLGPAGTHVVAPARRFSSAQQSALMLRECPRVPAVGCETGDWSHVDVYLTKTTDYRMLLLRGSRWEDELLGWVRERGTRVVAVGEPLPEAELTVRYRHDDVDDVRLLSEALIAELVAARAWAATR